MERNNDSSVINAIKERKLEQKKKGEAQKENIQEWSKVVNRLASTRDGKYFLKTMIHAVELFEIDETENPTKLLRNNGRKWFYLKHIRPYLTPEIKQEVE